MSRVIAAPRGGSRDEARRPRAVAGRLPRGPWLLAAVALVLLAACYAVALGVDAGLRVDRELRFPPVVGDWRFRDRVNDDVDGALMPILACIAGAAVLGAMALRRWRAVLAAALVVLGAGLLPQALKWSLERADPLGGEALRASAGAFPSGHACVALGVGLALAIAAPPRLRALAAAVGVAIAGTTAAIVLALGWHYPSDVVGAFLLAIAWSAIVLAVVDPGRDDRRARAPGALAGPAATAVLAVAATAALALGALAVLPDETGRQFVDAHPDYAAFTLLSAALALAGALAAQWILASARRRKLPAPDTAG